MPQDHASREPKAERRDCARPSRLDLDQAIAADVEGVPAFRGRPRQRRPSWVEGAIEQHAMRTRGIEPSLRAANVAGGMPAVGIDTPYDLFAGGDFVRL